MNKILLSSLLLVSIALTACSDGKTSLSGKACLGANNDTLVEGLNGKLREERVK